MSLEVEHYLNSLLAAPIQPLKALFNAQVPMKFPTLASYSQTPIKSSTTHQTFKSPLSTPSISSNPQVRVQPLKAPPIIKHLARQANQ